MSARTGGWLVAAGLALVPALVLAQDRAVPRGGGGGGGGSDAGSRHSSPGVQSNGTSGSGSSSSSSSGGYNPSYSSPSTAQRRHPRAGSGTGGGSGYYPGYPGYPGGGWGYGGYYPGYGAYWWPYGYYGLYGSWGGYGAYGSYWGGYPGGGGGYYYQRREGASLRVLVDPAEARVYVDGYYAGVVDDFDGLLQRLQVSPGRHDITFKLEGYKSHRMRVYVGPDATLKLYHDMQKGEGEAFEDLTGGAPPPERELRERDEPEDDEPPFASAPAEREPGAAQGKLWLSVQPEDASVYVDGAFRGSGREASSLRLAPGRHRIEVVRPGFRTAETEVEIPAGEATRLEVTLVRPPL